MKPKIESPEDAIVRITTTSICGSDLHIRHGNLGLEPGTIIGHEFTGIVEEVGSAVTMVKPGQRVLGAAGAACGNCSACKSGFGLDCEQPLIYGCGPIFGNLQGAQAEYVRAPRANSSLFLIPEGLSEEQVLFVGDILATGYMGVRGITPGGRGVQPGSTVAIFGAGPVGLCAVAAARLFGPARIISIDMVESRLQMAKNLGADHIIDASQENPVEGIMNLTKGQGANFVIEAVGSPKTFGDSLFSLAREGSLSIIGVFQQSVKLPIHTLMKRNIEIKVGLTKMTYTQELFALIQAGKLDLTPLITHRFPLSDVLDAYDMFEKKADGAIKVILNP